MIKAIKKDANSNKKITIYTTSTAITNIESTFTVIL